MALFGSSVISLVLYSCDFVQWHIEVVCVVCVVVSKFHSHAEAQSKDEPQGAVYTLLLSMLVTFAVARDLIPQPTQDRHYFSVIKIHEAMANRLFTIEWYSIELLH